MSTDSPIHTAETLPLDPIKWSQEIQDSIATAEISSAIKRLIDFVREYGQDPQLEDVVYLISMEYHQLQREVLMQTVDHSVARLTRNQIAARILASLRTAKAKINNG